MNPEGRNPEEVLDEAIAAVRNQNIDPQTLDGARQRVWERVIKGAEETRAGAVSGRISTCADFQALLPGYLAGTLSEGRRLLIEDHTHECVACRRALHQLSSPAAPRVTEMPARRPVASWRKYAVAASLLVTAGFAGWRAYEVYGPVPADRRAVVQSVAGNVFRLSGGALKPVLSGAEIEEGEVLRTAPGAHLMLKLGDGSIVEVSERAEFSVSMSRIDTTVRLDRGTLIVQAAKRGAGHLFVTSADCRVGVTGTVFAVNRGMKGSRVSVVEGSVEVEHSGSEVTLRPGDQVSTHTSMASVPIRQEIAWSQNLNQHLTLLNEIANLKSKLDAVRLPGLRYGSRLLDLVPADTVVFASVPNMGQALSEANRLFQEQIRFSPVLQEWSRQSGAGSQEKMEQAIEMVRRFSEYIGDELVVALASRSHPSISAPVILAEVHKTGFREFLNSELAKFNNATPKFRIVDGPVQSVGRDEVLVVLRGNYVIAGADVQAIEDVVRNMDGSGPRAFGSSELGRRVTDTFRRGAGVLVGFDLQRIGGFATKSLKDEREQQTVQALGADRIRYLVVEQKPVGNETQRSAELSFAGARSGVASWLGAPAAVGGLGFVSPDAQFVAAAVFKKPDQMIDDFFAFQPDAARMFEEARKHLGIDLKRDVAGALGGEVTFAIDGPVVPTISWKAVVDVTDSALLQQTIEKVVNAANLAVQLTGGQGYRLDSETSGSLTYHSIRSLDPSPVPEIHYVYTNGYLLIAPSRALLAKAMQNRQAGVTFVRSDRFRQLLPRDGHTNVSAIVYQNAGEWLGALANTLGSAEQRAAGDVAAKMGPILVCAYAEQDRIEVANKGSAWDVVMQSFLAPMLNPGTRPAARSYR
jgi:hypothetical protein